MKLNIKEKLENLKSKNFDKLKHVKRTVWYTVFTVVMAIFVFIIAASLIYSTFFESEINKEKNKKYAQEYMTEKLNSNLEEAEKYREANDAIIKKYSLDIFGEYSCTFNELESLENGEESS
ncbi:MAG: hypothetical protein J6V03_02775, partial [Clostridia bacterium]|nr:hypothetical protein [Clostridia bacterium]